MKRLKLSLPRWFDAPEREVVPSAENDVEVLGVHTREMNADALLRNLEWSTLRRLDGLLHGDYRTLLRGVGIDLADLREYQVHDDVRHIDWNVTARMQTPYVRQFTEDRDVNAWFLVDLSASVAFGSGVRTKRDVSIDFVAMMARLFSQHGNRVGAMLFGETVDSLILPRADRRHVLRLIHRMLHHPPQGATGVTRLSVLLVRACATLKRRSAVFVVSDFISDEGWQPWLSQLAQRHDLTIVRVSDPLEMSLPEVGLMTLEDPETGEQLFVDTSDPRLQANYVQITQAREVGLRETFMRSGGDVLPLSTQTSLIDSVVQFVNLRQRRSRLVGRKVA